MEEKPVQEKSEVKKGMPKQTLAFVTFLIVVTVLLVGLAVYTQKQAVPKPTPAAKNIVFPSYAHTVLKLTAPSNKPYTATYTSDVTIETGGDKITAAQLELSFDPKVLTNVQITPGTFVQNPLVLLKKVDQAKGRISLTIAVPANGQAPKGTGTIATITFDEVATATGSTILDFLPKTQVTAAGIAQSVLKESFGSLFFVNQSPVPAASGNINSQTSPSPVK